MRVRLLRLLAASILLLSASGLQAALPQAATPQTQTPEPTPPPDSSVNPPPPAVEPVSKPQFFAGTVTTMDKEHVTVSRTLVGKAPESKIFLINARTKLAKGLRSKLRVTVRYQHQSEGDVALEIQIRQSRPPKPS